MWYKTVVVLMSFIKYLSKFSVTFMFVQFWRWVRYKLLDEHKYKKVIRWEKINIKSFIKEEMLSESVSL